MIFRKRRLASQISVVKSANRTNALRLLVAAVAGIPAITAFADNQNTLETLDVVGQRPGLPLNQESGIGSRLGLTVEEQPGQVDVIDQQRMQERGDRTTTEAVTGSVGFTDSNTGGNLSGFSARGFNDVQVLYDGLRLGSPGMTVRPQGIWIYDRIETISGPASIVHGEGSIVGAVNYVPRRPNPDATETDLLLSAGSFNTSRVAVGHGGPTKVDGLSFRIDGERQSSDGYSDNSDMRRDMVSGSLRYDASERLTLSGNVVYLDDELPPYFGVPKSPDGSPPPKEFRRSNFNARDAFIEGDEVRLTLDADYRLNDNVQLHNRFYAYDGEREWANVETSEIQNNGAVVQTDGFSLDHFQTFLANRSEAIIDHDLLSLDARSSVGLQVSRNDFESNRSFIGGRSRDVGDPNNPDTGSILDIGFDRSGQVRRNERDTVALFAENQLQLGGGFSLISGVRGEWTRLELNNIDNFTETSSGDETYTTEEARLGFVWQANPALSLFGQVSTGSQLEFTPELVTVDDLDRDLLLSTGLEGGVRGQAADGTWQWQLTVFDIEKRNRLVSDPTPTDPKRERQVGRQTSQGLEVSAYVRPIESLSLEANGTVLDAEFEDDAEFGGNTPSNVPEQLANLWATWTVTERLLARGHVRYVGEAEANNENTLEIPSYTLLNVSASYAVDDNWDLTARARNITDELYYTQTYFNEHFLVGDGRSFEIEVSASF